MQLLSYQSHQGRPARRVARRLLGTAMVHRHGHRAVFCRVHHRFSSHVDRYGHRRSGCGRVFPTYLSPHARYYVGDPVGAYHESIDPTPKPLSRSEWVVPPLRAWVWEESWLATILKALGTTFTFQCYEPEDDPPRLGSPSFLVKECGESPNNARDTPN